ncbi:DUF1439 domain-containing protein [Poseidonibacter antarcticus]|uniref:DUF1439 domain-containing protein n=1 Tax=Poseidonibacter antarcticus TaxID=2478538 RepID=UPI000EF4F443|nr:DUF1439 domain-containing protein [Poseidonibacter antarcticus]
MFTFKKTQLILMLTLLLLFSGCIKRIGSDGLTLKLDPNELNMQSSMFPIEKNFTIAKVLVNKPDLGINTTNQITAIVDVDLKVIFMPDTKATLDIAGEPYFNKERNAIFLKNVDINKISFQNNDIAKNFSSELISSLDPLIDEVFKNIPVYTIKENSFKGSFVKDIKVEDSELLVTFGL